MPYALGDVICFELQSFNCQMCRIAASIVSGVSLYLPSGAFVLPPSRGVGRFESLLLRFDIFCYWALWRTERLQGDSTGLWVTLATVPFWLTHLSAV